MEKGHLLDGALICFLSCISECGEILIKYKAKRYFSSGALTVEAVIIIMLILHSDEKADFIIHSLTQFIQ